jgi:hypothetical protein
MTYLEIRIQLLKKRQGEPEKSWTLTAIAKRIGCRREELSMCVRQVRVYPEIQDAFAKELGLTREDIFGAIARVA